MSKAGGDRSLAAPTGEKPLPSPFRFWSVFLLLALVVHGVFIAGIALGQVPASGGRTAYVWATFLAGTGVAAAMTLFTLGPELPKKDAHPLCEADHAVPWKRLLALLLLVTLAGSSLQQRTAHYTPYQPAALGILNGVFLSFFCISPGLYRQSRRRAARLHALLHPGSGGGQP